MLKLSTSEFIKKANIVHDNTYDYSLVNYHNYCTKILIVCKTHGEFLQIPQNHLKGAGCPQCGLDKLRQPLLTVDKFLAKANIKHNNKYEYDISESNIHTKSYVNIKCPIHGMFKQLVNSHLNGRGCIKCAHESNLGNIVDFIQKANLKHNNKYDYSDVQYIDHYTKVKIKCPIHNEFWQKPLYHLSRGCPHCSMAVVGQSQRIDFITKAAKVHENKYDYSKAQYVGTGTSVTIVCPVHGDFVQNASNHLYKQTGCPQCGASANYSRIHRQLAADLSRFTEVEINNRQIIAPYEIDIWLPVFNIGIECNGNYWHSVNDDKSRYKSLHYKKADAAAKIGVQLLQFFEHELDNKYQIILDIIASKIRNNYKKLNARDCYVKLISAKQAYDFSENYHLQGGRYSSINIALFDAETLIQCISINPNKSYQYEIMRLTSKTNYQIRGGASKLLKYFINNYHPNTIMTYADRRYSIGNVYSQLGFKFLCNTRPNYFYCKSNKVYSRIQFQKHKLQYKLQSFDPNVSERQNMFNNGYRCLYDAGHAKFLWSN